MTIDQLNPNKRSLSDVQRANLTELTRRISLFEELIGYKFHFNPGTFYGFRSLADQLKVNSKSPKSSHCEGMAVDLADPKGEIYQFLIDNPDIVIKFDFYVERKDYTPGWCHIQIRPTKRRFFIPY